MLRMLAVILALLGMSGLAPPQACACSCAEPPSPAEQVAGYDAVFVGVPVDETRRDDMTVYAFEVSSVYTGDVTSRVEVSTRGSGGMCGRSYEIGTETLIFANSADGATLLSSSTICGPGGLSLSEAAEEVYGPPSAPAPTPAKAADNTLTSSPAGTLIAVAGIAVGVAAVIVVPLLWRRRRAM